MDKVGAPDEFILLQRNMIDNCYCEVISTCCRNKCTILYATTDSNPIKNSSVRNYLTCNQIYSRKHFFLFKMNEVSHIVLNIYTWL